MDFWTVQFLDYLKFDGVKEGIREMKNVQKVRVQGLKEKGYTQKGVVVEDGISKIVADYPGFNVKRTNPQMDIGFGADLLVSYKEADKNYSFFADVTTNDKELVRYLNDKGDTTDNIDEAFCYETAYFKIRFGLKEKHANWFFYEKPVVVLHIENYVPTTGLAVSDINNIANIMISLNSLLVQMGYGARASQKVRPNPKRFPNEYKASKQIKFGGNE